MRVWLDIHVFTGLTAATLVTFHSAFQLRTPIATISAASLGIVVLTGLIGRFLYALAPAADRQRLRDALDDDRGRVARTARRARDRDRRAAGAHRRGERVAAAQPARDPGAGVASGARGARRSR